MTSTLETIVPVSLVRAAGRDAQDFLHRLFSSDINRLGDCQALPAAWCQPNGRMAARVLVIREAAERMLIVVPQETSAAFVRRLKMFVLRSKVEITLDTGRRARGVLGGKDTFACAMDPWSCTQQGTALAVRLPEGTCPRFLVIADGDPGFAAGSLHAWKLEQIAACQAHIGAATANLELPQSLGLDCLGGVSYTKGCYPGQEVVTSMKFKAREVHRPACGTSPSACPIGSDVLRADGSPCGRVLECEPDGTGSFAVLVEALPSAIEAGVTNAQGEALRLALPKWLA